MALRYVPFNPSEEYWQLRNCILVGAVVAGKKTSGATPFGETVSGVMNFQDRVMIIREDYVTDYVTGVPTLVHELVHFNATVDENAWYNSVEFGGGDSTPGQREAAVSKALPP
jgi:hypothetical protein